jgi:PiT family inorganic phosphate transporter
VVVFWVLVGFATLTCLFMAWSLGANSNSPPFAPAIGANAVSTMRAAFLVGLLAAAGALTQGGAISETVGQNLIDGVTITPLAATCGLLVAASFMALGVYSGYPVPAAFATTGAMVGVGLSLGGAAAVETYQRIGLFWILVPPMSGGLAFVTAKLLRHDDVPETVGVPLLAAVVSAILAHIRLGVIPHPDRSQGSAAEAVALAVDGPTLAGIDPVLVAVTLAFALAGFSLIRRRTLASTEGGIRTFLVVLGSVVAFSSGGSQVGLATGPLENLYGGELGLPAIVLFGVGARCARGPRRARPSRCGRHRGSRRTRESSPRGHRSRLPSRRCGPPLPPARVRARPVALPAQLPLPVVRRPPPAPHPRSSRHRAA